MQTGKQSRQKSAIALGLVRLRRHLRETQAVFAKRMGVTSVTVARWETTHRPSEEALERICKVAEENRFSGSAVFRANLARDATAQSGIELMAAFDQPVSWVEAQSLLRTALVWAMNVKEDGPPKKEATEALFKLSDLITKQMHREFRDAVAAATGRGQKGDEK